MKLSKRNFKKSTKEFLFLHESRFFTNSVIDLIMIKLSVLKQPEYVIFNDLHLLKTEDEY